MATRVVPTSYIYFAILFICLFIHLFMFAFHVLEVRIWFLYVENMNSSQNRGTADLAEYSDSFFKEQS